MSVSRYLSALVHQSSEPNREGQQLTAFPLLKIDIQVCCYTEDSPPFLTMTAHVALSALSYLANHTAGVTTGLTPIRFSPGTSRLHQPHTGALSFFWARAFLWSAIPSHIPRLQRTGNNAPYYSVQHHKRSMTLNRRGGTSTKNLN